MEQAGVDDRELAQKCRTTAQEVRAWRAGDSQPGKTEFNRLVARLRRPRAVYFLPKAPADDPVMASFRHPPGATADRTLIDREQTSIRTAERIQQVGRWTRRQTAVEPDSWPHLARPSAGIAGGQAGTGFPWLGCRGAVPCLLTVAGGRSAASEDRRSRHFCPSVDAFAGWMPGLLA
jgi:hypothetical protein